MIKKNILFIATAFSPENAVGSIRTTKIVKYLIRNEYNVTVLSPQLHKSTNYDYSNESDELLKVNRVVIPHSKFFEFVFLRNRNKMLQKKSASNYIEIKNNNSILSKLKSQIFILIHFIYTLIRNKDWSRKVNNYISKNINIPDFDSVISSYPSLSAHWVSSNLSKKYKLFWIADFRDPINYEANSNSLIIRINTYFQNRIIKQANFITTISVDLLSKFNPNNKFDSNKLKCIPNGFDPDDLEENKVSSINPSKVLNLCYVGSLYGGKRDLGVVFKVINELIKENKIVKENINITYAGKEFNVFNNQASHYELSSILVNKGFVSRLESVKIQSSSDLIIIVTWNTEKDKGIMTGKLFECLLTKKMILGVVNGTVPNSEMKRVVNNINGGIIYEEASLKLEKEFEDLKEYILNKYIEKQTNLVLKPSYNDSIKYYEYSEITKSFIKLLENNY